MFGGGTSFKVTNMLLAAIVWEWMRNNIIWWNKRALTVSGLNFPGGFTELLPKPVIVWLGETEGVEVAASSSLFSSLFCLSPSSQAIVILTGPYPALYSPQRLIEVCSSSWRLPPLLLSPLSHYLQGAFGRMSLFSAPKGPHRTPMGAHIGAGEGCGSLHSAPPGSMQSKRDVSPISFLISYWEGTDVAGL